MLRAVNIKWDIDIEDVIEKLDNMTAENAAEALDIPYQEYVNMSTSEIHDYAYDVFERSQSIIADIMGLPEEVDIPEDVDEEDIEDYISDEVGYTFSEYELCEVCFVLPVSKQCF